MPKGNIKKFFTVTAVIGLLIFFHYLGFLRPAETLIFKVFQPVLVNFYQTSSYFRISLNIQKDKRDLAALLKEKETEVNNLLAENVRLESLEEENEILREYLKFSKEENRSFILSNIIFKEGIISGSLEQNIILDKGLAQGVKEGAAVLDSRGVIVGKIISAKSNMSEACLVTNNECKIAASLQNDSQTAGIVEGEHGLTIKMEFIPQTVSVKEGDIVVTSGLEQVIPKGLIIGKVTKVDKESNELWQSAVIEPLVNLDNLVIVAVLL